MLAISLTPRRCRRHIITLWVLISTLLAPAAIITGDLKQSTPSSEAAALRDEMRDIAGPLMKKHRVYGIGIALIENGRLVSFDAIHDERHKSAPYTIDTIFNVASISKCVAA